MRIILKVDFFQRIVKILRSLFYKHVACLRKMTDIKQEGHFLCRLPQENDGASFYGNMTANLTSCINATYD